MCLWDKQTNKKDLSLLGINVTVQRLLASDSSNSCNIDLLTLALLIFAQGLMDKIVQIPIVSLSYYFIRNIRVLS